MSKFDIKDLLAKIKKLEADLFNEQQHYETLKESYDLAFEFMKENGLTFDDFEEWLLTMGKRDENI